MSLINWPFKRKQYAGLNNPRFVSDVVAGNEAVIDGLKAICGLLDTDFAIFSGMVFDQSSNPGTYTPGIFFLNGSFYMMFGGITEGVSLIGQPTDIMNKVFGNDAGTKPIYTSYIATTSPPDVLGNPLPGASPIFSGNMAEYRLNLTFLRDKINTLWAIASGLGNSSTRNVGTIPGTVAAGDDARFGYTIAQANAKFAQILNVILKGDTADYTPVAPLDPVNKRYADGISARLLVRGFTNIGDIPPGGVTVNVSFGTTLTNANYLPPVLGIKSQGTPTNDATAHLPATFAYSTTGFSVRFQEGVGLAQNIAISWFVFDQ